MQVRLLSCPPQQTTEGFGMIFLHTETAIAEYDPGGRQVGFIYDQYGIESVYGKGSHDWLVEKIQDYGSALVFELEDWMVNEDRSKSGPGFQGKLRFCSNFWPSKFVHSFDTPVKNNRVVPDVERAYQASKFTSLDKISAILATTSPGRAKKMGRTLQMEVEGFDEKKEGIMLTLVRAKFKIHRLNSLLQRTGGDILVEDNYWHDQFWGNCVCDKHKSVSGQNKLGEILMKVREENNEDERL